MIDIKPFTVAVKLPTDGSDTLIAGNTVNLPNVGDVIVASILIVQVTPVQVIVTGMYYHG